MLSGSDFWGWAFESYVCFRLLPLKMPVLHTIMRTRHCHTFPLPEVSAPCIYHSNGMILLTNHDPNETFPPFSWFCQELCHNNTKAASNTILTLSLGFPPYEKEDWMISVTLTAPYELGSLKHRRIFVQPDTLRHQL